MPARSQPSNPISPAYAVCGQEAFLKRQALDSIIHRVLGNADRSLAFSEFDGSSASIKLADVFDELRTLPFLTERRLVLVYDADEFITRHRTKLEEYLDSPSPTGVLLLECGSLPSNTRLCKRIAACGEVIKCEAVALGKVPGWLTQRAQDAHGVKLDAPAANLLRDLVGVDLGLLDGELQKLALYVGQRARITREDVERLTGHCREEQIWGIISAILAGNQSQAMSLWEEVWETDRAASARAIAGLAFSVRKLLNAKRAQEAGTPASELARILMVWDAQRATADLAVFTTAQIEQMVRRLQEADVAAKTGAASVQSSVESFIVEMCRARRGRRATG